MKKFIILFIFSSLINFNCSTERHVFEEQQRINEDEPNTNSNTQKSYKLLSLGDSYTIGESVCETCRFPEQLMFNLKQNFESDTNFDLKIIARTGWTTTNLINTIEAENIDNTYDLVTLLIGVNNQYQSKPFSLYEIEFPQLINTAIAKGKGNKSNIILISIPDYAFTPFGRGKENISTEIDKYNTFAKNYCDANNITYVNITDITREGLNNTDLVADDGLHPSELAYSKFVGRLLPIAIDKLND